MNYVDTVKYLGIVALVKFIHGVNMLDMFAEIFILLACKLFYQISRMLHSDMLTRKHSVDKHTYLGRLVFALIQINSVLGGVTIS